VPPHKLFVTNLHKERSLFPLQLAFYSAAKREAPAFRLFSLWVYYQIGVR